jgi:hypothetical protein
LLQGQCHSFIKQKLGYYRPKTTNFMSSVWQEE